MRVGTHVTKARFSRKLLPLWLLWFALAAGDIALMLWDAPGESPAAVPALSGFLLLLLIILLSARMDESVGRRMQATTDAVASAMPPETEQRVPPSPTDGEVAVPVFSLDVITPETLPPLSPEAEALVQRGRSFYRERLRIYRQGVLFLLAAHVAIALLGGALANPYPIPRLVVVWLLAAFLALTVLASPDRLRLILVPGVWLILDWACVAVTAVLAAIYAAKGLSVPNVAALTLAFVTIAAIAAHTWWTRLRNAELRRKVMAAPSVNVLFLWVFASYSPALLFLGFAAVWRFLGTIQLLNGAGFMGDTIGIARSVMRRSADMVVKTPEELSERVRAFERAPNRMAMYPHNTLLCNDIVWKLALDTLLDESDVVLMDLRGFSPVNQGASYELRHLIDRFPTTRFVLLADESTDLEFLRASLRLAWDSMALDSPNRGASSAPVRLFNLPRGIGQEGQFPQLNTIAREGDRLVELLCARAADSSRRLHGDPHLY
jgi:hypothetical protein